MAYRALLRAYLAKEANPPHKFGHQPRLYLLTQQIGSGLLYDDDVVFAACWLHDLGVFIGHRPEEPALLTRWNHVTYTCEQAPRILTGMGFPDAKIPAVLEVMRTHQPQDEPATLEAEIVRDADMLEQLGAVGVLRTAAKLGSDNRFVYFADAERSLRKVLETLPGMMRLPATRKLAEGRIALLHAFLEALKAESRNELG